MVLPEAIPRINVEALDDNGIDNDSDATINETILQYN